METFTEVRDYVLDVIKELIERYDIDGVSLDFAITCGDETAAEGTVAAARLEPAQADRDRHRRVGRHVPRHASGG